LGWIGALDEIWKRTTLGRRWKTPGAIESNLGVAMSFCTFSPGRKVFLNVLYFCTEGVYAQKKKKIPLKKKEEKTWVLLLPDSTPASF
jgi:hypothetical protein